MTIKLIKKIIKIYNLSNNYFAFHNDLHLNKLKLLNKILSHFSEKPISFYLRAKHNIGIINLEFLILKL